MLLFTVCATLGVHLECWNKGLQFTNQRLFALRDDKQNIFYSSTSKPTNSLEDCGSLYEVSPSGGVIWTDAACHLPYIAGINEDTINWLTFLIHLGLLEYSLVKHVFVTEREQLCIFFVFFTGGWQVYKILRASPKPVNLWGLYHSYLSHTS